jgi:hypothetical protein
MDQSYDENVTVLFTDGGRRSTEVLQSYTGFQTSLENVLYGSIANMPTYQDGTLTVRDNAVVFLEGNGSYEFAKLELIATADSEEIYHYDLLGNTGGVIAAEEPESEEEVSDSTTDDGEPRANTDRLDQTADDAGNEDVESRTSDAETASDQETQTANPESTEAADEATTNNDTTNGNTSEQEPVSGFSTERELNLTYALPAGTAVRIYLTATTEDGYQFTYDLFNGVTSEDEEDEFGFETSEDYFADNYAVYDKKQNVYFIQ